MKELIGFHLEQLKKCISFYIKLYRLQKDAYLLLVDSDTDPSTIKQVENDALLSETNKRKQLHNDPPVVLPNAKTNPPKKGGFGYAQIGLSPYPEHLPDPMTRESSIRGIGGQIIADKPFLIKVAKKSETFSTIPETYGYKRDFKPRPVEEKIEPKFGPWYTSHPGKKGNAGYPNISFSKYPEHFQPNEKESATIIDDKDKAPWKNPGIPLAKPTPSIAMKRISIQARRR